MSASTENEQPQNPDALTAMPQPRDPALDGPTLDEKGRPLDVVPSRVTWSAFGVFVLVADVLAWVVCLPLWVSGAGLSDPVLLQLCAMAMMFTPLLATIAALFVQRRPHAKRRRAGARPASPARPEAPARPGADTSAADASRLASIPHCLGLWSLYPIGRVLGMSGLAVLGVYALMNVSARTSLHAGPTR